ncbi:MAG TPA: glycosyltransferase family 4 protein [Nocardioidaceae bacterium]|nr:glycosyltransferase family 4 protein [Nocardioidaceae bacterium]
MADGKRGRGRVVMLVDNRVEGDSRVQKQARSMAERGWDVVLLGRSPDKRDHRWRLGDARVRLVAMPTPLVRPRNQFGRALLRAPLAYPEGRLLAYQQQLAVARRLDVRVRRAALARDVAAGRRTSASALTRRGWLWLARAYAKARADLVAARVRSTERLATSRGGAPRKPGRRRKPWRRLDPGLWDWELAFGPVVDRLAPDLIHANDFRMLGVGARAKLRAGADGRDVKLVWDAHEFLPGREPPAGHHPRWHEAQISHEAEYVPFVDAAVTTSEMMVELLTEAHGLTSPPTIVRNAPTRGLDSPADPDAGPGVRQLCGLADNVPLLLYIGVTAPQRGVDTMIEALPQLDGVHVALVARESKNLDRLTTLADRLGVRDRVHTLPYVPVDQIVPHIASVDVGVFPALHNLSHDSDLPTKFYEYAQARLPMVVSDVKTTAETTQMLGQGEVFAAGDVDDYVRAVKLVLGDLPRYRAAYDARADLLEVWTWERQADILCGVYERLLRS